MLPTSQASGQTEALLAMQENPARFWIESDVNTTFMTPVLLVIALGIPLPLNGLPASSVLEVQEDVVQEYTLTKS